jgi:diguanylate cyclase (GGDEF)-like protein
MSGSDVGRRFRLFEGLAVIGRSHEECEVFLDDAAVSRAHAQVILGPERVATVRDCGSTNGTRCNGEEVGETPRPLRDGDKLQLGETLILEFRYQSSLTAAVQEHMYSSAVRDGLTGVFNKAYFSARLEQEFAYTARHGTTLALAVLDLDHFKRVNDTYGHAAGDHVLKSLCRLVEAGVRQEDVFARYGGEEFVILMRLGANVAARLADRVRGAVAEHSITFEGNRIPVTVSIGVAVAPDEEISSPAELFAKADAALYRAKRAGRNRVCGPDGVVS